MHDQRKQRPKNEKEKGGAEKLRLKNRVMREEDY